MPTPSPAAPAVPLFPWWSGTDPTRVAFLAAVTGLAWFGLAPCPRAADGPVALDAPVSALWNAVPLRTWATRATTLAGRPVVVDRRLDPDTVVSGDYRGEPLGAVLEAVAGEAGAVAEPLRSWVRIGPAATAGRATGGERQRITELAGLPATARTAVVARRKWSWTDGARPRDLVAAACAEAGTTVAGLEAVPHDHLPAASLPPLPLAERLDLLLAHYDLRVSWTAGPDDSATGSIVPLPATPPRAGGPEAVAAPPRAARSPAPPPRATDRFTLRLEAPLDEALAALGPRLGLEPVIDRESLAARGIQPGEVVRVTITDATREQLLDAIVNALGLRWRVEGRRLVVEAP